MQQFKNGLKHVDLIKCDEESVSVTLEIENELEELKERLDTILSKQPNVNKETKLVLS